MSWKDEVEMNIGVNYTAHSGSNTTRDGLKKIYYCRRSGVKKASGDSCNKRAEKSQGKLYGTKLNNLLNNSFHHRGMVRH